MQSDDEDLMMAVAEKADDGRCELILDSELSWFLFAFCMSRRPSMDARYDHELARVWQLVAQLSEQLAINQNVTATLQSQVDALKVRATSISLSQALKIIRQRQPKQATTCVCAASIQISQRVSRVRKTKALELILNRNLRV